MGVVVGIQSLLVVPAVSSGAGELDPFVVVLWCGALGGEVAARAHLHGLAEERGEKISTYMLRSLRAGGDVVAGSVGQILVPDEVLSAVNAAPPPVGVHRSSDEVAVIALRRVIAVESSGLDIVFVQTDGSSSEQSHEESENSEELHVVDAAQRC